VTAVVRNKIFSFLVGVALILHAIPSAAKNELVIGISQYPSTLHPNIESMLAKVYVLGMVRRPLTAYEQSWSLTCMLCTELPSLEAGTAKLESYSPVKLAADLKPPMLTLPKASPNRVKGQIKDATKGQSGQPNDVRQGIAVTYEIDARAVWGDGTPVTTDDVVFTWEVGRSPISGVAGQETYRRIRSIDQLSDKRFTLHVDRVTFDYAALALELLPAHLERKIFRANESEYRTRTLFETDPTNPGLHYGPYRITAVRRGAFITLEPNPKWWGEKVAFSRITIRAIEKTAALEANLLSGSIDYIAGELGLALDQAIAFEARNKDRFNVFYKPGLIYEHIDFNLDNPILALRDVRQALLLGIDREAISTQLFAGKQPVAHSNVSPLDAVFSPDVPRYEYAPTRATQLLDDAGWRVMKKGIRHDANGTKLSIELMTTAGNRTRELVQQVIQSQLRQLGVEIRIRNQPARVFFGETISKRQFTGMAMYAWISSPESVPRSTLHSEEIPSADNGWSGQNASGFRNTEVDQLLDTIEVELDAKKRKAMWARLQTIYAQELPVMPLYFRANAYIVPKWLTAVNPTGHQFPSTLWVEQWRLTGQRTTVQ
jgi:peptide/nickel transport system substrate-binding protein